MARALILGGTGMIGSAVARHLLARGWSVDVTGRDPAHVPADLVEAGGRFLRSDRTDPQALRTAVGAGADLLVDCACSTARDAALLVPVAAGVGSTVMLSSKAVYVDAAGRHVNSPTGPHFDGPVREDQPTMAPADVDHRSREGYGANKVAAEQVLLDSGLPVTVLRPSKVHGRGGPRPREWVFVKRVLDRRPAVLLARGGAGVDHTTAAANLAALVETVARRPGRRILNCADPDAPSAREIARTVAAHLGHRWEEVLLDGTAPDGPGRTPWDAPHPIVLDTTAARELGYEPVGSYPKTVTEELDWLAAHGPQGPAGLDAEFFAPLLDYAAEDRYLAAAGRGA